VVGSVSRPGKSTATLPRVPDFQRIEDDLRRRIGAGEFAPGSKLPSQQALAEHYDTSLQPVKTALMRLELAGLVEGQQGKGVFVIDRGTPDA
jgi:GntR family transcriptional regulator